MCAMLHEMSRRSRRHGEDPVEEAQEEANWSGFTRHIRATDQGKWFFSRSRSVGSGRTPTSTIVLAVVIATLCLGAVVAIITWLLSL